MTLRLSIENVDRLPDGGPIRIEVKGRGLDVGRDSHLDWTLPDPGRSISGKHCEIRYRDGGYWLHDVSTNGTFVNGAEYRLDAPHLLRNGDRLNIGPYIVAVAVEEGRKLRSSALAAGASLDASLSNVWAPAGGAAAPEIAGKRQRAPRAAPPDFLDFASFLEAPKPGPDASLVQQRSEDDWLTAVQPVAPAPSVGSGGSRASHTDADAARDHRPGAQTAITRGAATALIAPRRRKVPRSHCPGSRRSYGRFHLPQPG